MYYSWIEGSFILEDANPSVGCLDYLQIEAGTSGATIPYKCGYQTAFSDVTSMPIKMEFRSNTKKRYLGFQIDILCVNSQLSETMTTTGGGLTIEGKVTNRGGDPLTVGCQELPDPNENIRVRRQHVYVQKFAQIKPTSYITFILLAMLVKAFLKELISLSLSIIFRHLQGSPYHNQVAEWIYPEKPSLNIKTTF